MKFPDQNQIDLSGLFLLAAFPKHSGDSYERFGALMELWPACMWLYSSMVLNEDLRCKFPFILTNFETCYNMA